MNIRQIAVCGLFSGLFSTVQAAELSCPTTPANADIAALLDSADSALNGADVDGFRSTIEKVALSVPCLSEPITQEIAARLHAFQGIRHYVAGETDQATGAFFASRVLNSETSLPAALFPEGHEIHGVFNDTPVDTARTSRLPAPKEGKLLIDGEASPGKPMERPFVAQRIDGDTVLDTRYLGIDDAVINYDVSRVSRLTSSGPRARRLQLSLLPALPAAVLYGMAWAELQKFEALEDHSVPSDEVDTQRVKSGVFVGASGALALTSVGLMWTSFGLADE